MRPSKRLVALSCLWIMLAVIVAVFPAGLSLWWGAAVLLAALMLIDALRLVRLPIPAVIRQVSHSLPLNAWSTVKLLFNGGGRSVKLLCTDHHPLHAEVQGLPVEQVIPKEGWLHFQYQLQPTQRGDQRFGHVDMLIESPWRLWRRRVLGAEPTPVRVYPDFASVAKYALLATDHHLSQIGVRKRRRRGEGLEFHQLREYRPGDALRQIDWKATSRQRKLISREYQDERDQQVLFLFDCGRRMLSKDGALTHFDHSLNSMLLLAYVALRQGDAVGVMAFSGNERFLPPKKGGDTLNALLNGLYDLQPALVAPDYVKAAVNLLKRLNKRSLIIVLTNLRDEDNDELMTAVRLLKKRHLVVVASMRESILGAALKAPVAEFPDALTLAATHQYLNLRHKAFDKIKQTGVLSLDVEPAALPMAMVNCYLDIKLSGRL